MKKIFVIFLSLCLALGSCAGAFAAVPVGPASTNAAAGRSAPVPTRDPYSHSVLAPTENPYSHSVSVETPKPAQKPTLSPEQIKRIAQLEKELKELTKKKKEYEEKVMPFKTMVNFMALLVMLHKTYGIHPSLVIELMMRLRLPIPIFPMTLRDLEDIAFFKEEIERLEREIANIREEIRKIKEGIIKEGKV